MPSTATTPTDTPTPQEKEHLKQKLVDFFHKSGHVAKEGVDALAGGAMDILFDGKLES